MDKEALDEEFTVPDGRVLVGVPAHNEELSIGTLLWKLDRIDVVDDVLVVDDGSSDETSDIAVSYGAIVRRHEDNVGKGGAIKTIFNYASKEDYDYLVLIDADGQHNPYEIPKLISSLIENGTDMVIGGRWGESTEMPLYRKGGKFVLDHFTPGGKGLDTQSGFRALNKKAIKKMELTQNDFTVESEMLAEADKKDLEVDMEQITCKYDDIEDPSNKGPVAHGMEVLHKLIRMTIERRPLLYLGVPGLVFYIAGLITGFKVIRIASNKQVLSVGFGLLTIVFIILGSIFVTSGFTLNEIRRLMLMEAEEELKEVEEVNR